MGCLLRGPGSSTRTLALPSRAPIPETPGLPERSTGQIFSRIRVPRWYNARCGLWDGFAGGEMKKISGSTFYFKKLFPTFWFGFLGFFLVVSFFVSDGNEESIPFLIVPAMMGVFGFFLFKKLVWDLADEVYDHGDSLEFRKGGRIQRVNLTDIVNIDYAGMRSPERVVIHTRTEGPIGKELAFCPPMRFFTFSKNPLVLELIERVDAARRQ